MPPSLVRRGLVAAALAATVSLGGCTTQPAALSAQTVPRASETPFAARPHPGVPGGVVRWGGSTASMAEQYAARPAGLGPVAAGASAWVAPAPGPAFAIETPLPPADPPAPPPAAVANRQPASPAADAGAAEMARPEAAAPRAAPPIAGDPALRAQALALFNDYSCGVCHALADARATGTIGPSLDRNPILTRAYALDVIAHGRGAMPAFGGQMSEEEIELLADYIVRAAL